MSKIETLRRLDDTGQQRETVRTIADLQHQIEQLQNLPDQVRQSLTLMQQEASSTADQVQQSLMLMRQETSATAERMAIAIEPLAQAMARLTDETREALSQIEARSKEQIAAQKKSISESHSAAMKVSREATEAARRLEGSTSSLTMSHYGLAAMMGLLSAALTTAFWLFLSPPTIQNQINPEAIARMLWPAISQQIAQQPPSAGKSTR